MYPPELRYDKEHQWARDEGGGEMTIGISHFAQEQLGDVVYVGLPGIGTRFAQFGKFGEIESVKAVSDLFTPVSGEVIAVNGKLKDKPELVNQDPYGEGWMLRLKMSDPSDLTRLLTAAQYEQIVKDAG
ncbi:MAG: glycine cleavage system protein GcvH [Chloroflexi bacterium]|nr:glycine cleavage system protein GcvH [Chloroflexota bacterium]